MPTQDEIEEKLNSIKEEDGALEGDVLPPIDIHTETILRENSKLRFEVEKLEAEKDRLSGIADAAGEKAKLIGPYSWWVYYFVCAYCLIVFGIVVVDGAVTSINIDDIALAILTGTTAASVLGLIGIILTGLFKKD